MILLLDNYDSFTYNLFQALASLGSEVVVRRSDEISAAEVEELDPRGIVISPGPGRPESAGNSESIINACGQQRPVLGVCLGHQCIGHVLGADVVRAPDVMHGKVSRVSHDGSGVFAGLPSPFEAVRYHSLVIDRGTLPESLRVTAQTEDGIVMGVAHRELPLTGVQFHPESVLTRDGPALLRNFLEICQEST